MPGVSFTTESGAAFLDGAFAEVTLYPHAVPLAFPSAGPVVGYLDSVREPILRGLGEPVDFDAALSDVAARVSQVIRADGRFRTTSRSGVFACRARD